MVRVWFVLLGLLSGTQIFGGGAFPPLELDFLESNVTAGRTLTCTDDGLRLRKGLGLTSPVVGTLKKDQIVTLVMEGKTEKVGNLEARWLLVRTADGMKAWTYGGYLRSGPLTALPSGERISFRSEVLGIQFSYPRSWGYCYAGRWTQFYGKGVKNSQEDRLFFSKEVLETAALEKIPVGVGGTNYEAEHHSVDVSVSLFSSPRFSGDKPRTPLLFSSVDDREAMTKLADTFVSSDWFVPQEILGRESGGADRFSLYRVNSFERIVGGAMNPWGMNSDFGRIEFLKTYVILTGRLAPHPALVVTLPLKLADRQKKEFEDAVYFFPARKRGTDQSPPPQAQLAAHKAQYYRLIDQLIRADRSHSLDVPEGQVVEDFVASIRSLD